jgi:PAS domain S-box-containing protein
MKPQLVPFEETNSPLLPVAAIVFALAIFVVDTYTPLGIAVAVLYVVVVLMAGRFFQRRGVLIVGFACLFLTILSYLIQHGETYGAPFIRCLVSLAAIGITTFLALRIQAAGTVLREQAKLLDLSHDTIFVRDMNTVITFWNRGAEQLYGWTREEAIGKVAHQLLKTVFPVPLKGVMEELLNNDRWEGQLIHTKRDGSQVVVASRWSLQRDKAGRPVAVLETNNDVTERKQAEDALRQSEAYLTEAQRLSSTGSFGWIVSPAKIHWSEQAYRIFECDRATEPTLDFILERTHPEDRDFLQRLLQRVSRNRDDWEIEHRLLMPDGTIKYIHAVAHATQGSGGELIYIGALMDVTATKRAEQDLHRMQAELSHVTRVTTLGELTASIAHEVNQPLAAVVTNADSSLRWLNRETPQLGEARNALERIIRDANRASEVIRRIRNLASNSGQERVPVDLNEAIRDSLLLLQHELTRQGVTLRLELASPLPSVLGDRVQLQQVVINLMMNGIEAMANVKDRSRQLVVRSDEHGPNQVLVVMQDSGTGIDSEHAERLFEAFFTTKQGGMGMGLSICRSIVEAHEGRLWATPNDGPGTTFQFILPADGASGP